ncbi:YncE family protein [uncultured Methylobacterium sp.]|uniref:YncE family protein n=1 Tax=uncultured Methylobacterium sp. TaxID=157278 RepID=UPI0035CB8326
MLVGRAAFGAALWLAAAGGARAEIAVSANDGKATLENGAQVVPGAVVPDTVSVIDLSASPPRVLSEIAAPASVAGPPSSVAVAPDESFALVTAAQKLDPKAPKTFAPDDRLSVIDLRTSPPKVVATHPVGPGAAGVSINRAGTLALVANRNEGTVSVFTIKAGVLADAGRVRLGDEKSGPSAIAFTRDGKTAYVTRDGDWRISVLTIDGDTVAYAKRDLFAGIRPYGIDITGEGALAAVANIGMGMGDADTVSLIDLTAKPPRVVATTTVGQTPEGLKLSPDGAFLAVGVINGSNKAASSPFYSEHGLLKIYRISGFDLVKVAEAEVGHWCQGIVWSRDGRTLLTQCMIEREILAFSFDGSRLAPAGTIRTGNGPAGIRTAEP